MSLCLSSPLTGAFLSFLFLSGEPDKVPDPPVDGSRGVA